MKIDAQAVDRRRVFVGGLSEGISKTDLEDRFGRFGSVTSVDIKTKRDSEGQVVNVFAHMNIDISENNFKKCMGTYNGAKWKGQKMKVQLAKENFLTKLEAERLEASEMIDTKPVVARTASSLEQEAARASLQENMTKAGVQGYIMKNAVPGTPIPGEENWIVGKYGRILPIMHLKCRDMRRRLTHDPSKYTHHVRMFKENEEMNKLIAQSTLTSLTRSLPEETSDMDRKRMGEFPESYQRKKLRPPQDSSGNVSLNNTDSQTVGLFTELGVQSELSYEVVAKPRHSKGSKVLVGANVSNLKHLPLSKMEDVPAECSLESDGDSCGSVDTDEICSTARKTTKPEERNVSVDWAEEFYRGERDAALVLNNAEYESKDVRTCENEGSRQDRHDGRSDLGGDSIEEVFVKDAANTSNKTALDCDDAEESSADNDFVRKVSVDYDSVEEDSADCDSVRVCGSLTEDCGGDDSFKISTDKKEIATNKQLGYSTEKTPVVVVKGENQRNKTETVDGRNRRNVLDKPSGGDTVIANVLKLSKDYHLKKENVSDNKAGDNDDYNYSESSTEESCSSTDISEEPAGLDSSNTFSEKSLKSKDDLNSAVNEAKHIHSDKVRLESLRKRQLAIKTQNAAVQKALQARDSQVLGQSPKQHVRFESDSNDEGESGSDLEVENTADKSLKEASSKKSWALFDDEHDDGEKTKNGADDDWFRIKPQFQGKAGEKLFELQDNNRGDSRFKLGEAFQEDPEHQSGENDEDEEELKDKEMSLSVLQSIVGSEAMDVVKRKITVNFKSCRWYDGYGRAVLVQHYKLPNHALDPSQLRYDPTRADHCHFEVEGDISSNRLPSKQMVTISEGHNEIPATSKEMFYEVSDLSFVKNGNKPFSFFGDVNSDADKCEEDDKEGFGSIQRDLLASTTIGRRQLNLDSSDEDDDEAKLNADKFSQEGKQPGNQNNIRPFFFQTDDSRLKSGAELFCRKLSREDLDDWLMKQKPELQEEYKKRHQRALRDAKKTTQRNTRQPRR